MNKKVIVLILIILIVSGALVYLKLSTTSKNNTSSKGTIDNNISDEKDNLNSKILVVYFSATSHTKAVAEKIKENLKADIFEITPTDTYTDDDLDYNNDNSRVVKEYNDETLRDVKLTTTKVENWDSYDTILIGYPIWWGIAAWPVNTFVKANDFTGKTVIPFCTSASSGLGQSGELLAKDAKTGNWVTGHRFSSNPSDNDIKKWTDSLKNGGENE